MKLMTAGSRPRQRQAVAVRGDGVGTQQRRYDWCASVGQGPASAGYGMLRVHGPAPQLPGSQLWLDPASAATRANRAAGTCEVPDERR